jgi:hypothetical protein
VFAADPLGTYLTSISTAGTPYSIAVDQAEDAIYVSETGTAQIARYLSDRKATPTYTLDPTFKSPKQGEGAGEVGNFASPIAVDPTTHDLLVGDTGNNRVSRFDASGAFLSSFDGEGSDGGAFTGILDLEVAADGDVYVVNGFVQSYYGSVEMSRVVWFHPDGTAAGSLTTSEVEHARSIAIDPVSDDLFVSTQGGPFAEFFGPTQIRAFAGGTFRFVVPFPDAVGASATVGLAVDAGSSGRLYALTASQETPCCGHIGTDSVQAFKPSAVPGAEMGPVTDVTPTSARLSGSVDTGGRATTVAFEYSSDAGKTWSSTAPQALEPAPEEQGVEAVIGDLAPNTEYAVRLLATNSDGFGATSATASFNTAQSAPAVETGAASDVGATGVTLNGRINPFGLATTYHFEYGPTTSYGNRVPAADAAAGNGRVPRLFGRGLTGLDPATTYHFRLVATSAAGTSPGEDQTFTTSQGAGAACANAALRTGPSAELSDCRAYEQVTPVDKGGATLNLGSGPQAAANGDGMAFQALQADSSPMTEAAPLQPRSSSIRGADGWTSKALDPPAGISEETIFWGTIAVSEDHRHSIAVSNYKLAPGGIEGGCNLYLRDWDTGQYKTIVASPNPSLYGFFTRVQSQDKFLAGAPDFSWIVFESEALSTDSNPNGRNIYKWTLGGGLELISVLPGEVPITSGSATSRRGYLPLVHPVSDDGDAIAFQVSGSQENDGIYVREGGATEALSVSQRAGDPPTPRPGELLDMSRDGRYVLFLSAQPLTEDAGLNSVGMYRYDRQTGQLLFIAPDLQGYYRFIGMAADGRSAYFGLFEAGSVQYRVWRQGEGVKVVAQSSQPGVGGVLSPSGRYLAFADTTRLTSYDNYNSAACASTGGACEEIYLYDAERDQITCASCPQNGEVSTGNASLSIDVPEISNYQQRSVTDGGRLFFDTPTSLVARDVNGAGDVYEYSAGAVRLISPGNQPFDAKYADASADGNDVFFYTKQVLTPSDQDTLFDIYDARIGGGIPAQNAIPRGGCIGEVCRGTAGAVPSTGLGGSESLVGPGSSTARAHKRCAGVRHTRRSGKGRCVKHSAKDHRQRNGHDNRRLGR